MSDATAHEFAESVRGRGEFDLLTDREIAMIRPKAAEAHEMVEFLEKVIAHARTMAHQMEHATTVGDARKLLGATEELAVMLDRL